jgi:hypothetical protein
MASPGSFSGPSIGSPDGPMTWCSEPLLSDLETGEDAASLLPVFVIDMAAGALVAANAAG